jgi:transcriptional regulator with XRE-family HTH domain
MTKPKNSNLPSSNLSSSNLSSTKSRSGVQSTGYGSVRSRPTPSQRGAAIRAAYRGKFTQVQLAQMLGVAQNTISRWSTGDVEPSLDDLIQLEDVCGLPRGHILRAAGYVQELGAAEDFIAADHRLDPIRRELLLSAYTAALHQSQRSSLSA